MIANMIEIHANATPFDAGYIFQAVIRDFREILWDLQHPSYLFYNILPYIQLLYCYQQTQFIKAFFINCMKYDYNIIKLIRSFYMFPKMISKLTCFLMLFTVIACSITMPAHCDTPAVSAPSAILMEASTGTVIYEKEADTKASSCKHNQNYDPHTDF